MWFRYTYKPTAPPTPVEWVYLTTYNTDLHSRSLERHAVFTYFSKTLSLEVTVGRYDTIWGAVAIAAMAVLGIVLCFLVLRFLLVITLRLFRRFSPRRWEKFVEARNERQAAAQKEKEEAAKNPKIVITKADVEAGAQMEMESLLGPVEGSNDSSASMTISTKPPRSSGRKLLKKAWSVGSDIILVVVVTFLQLQARGIAVAVASNKDDWDVWKPELIALWPWPIVGILGGALLTTLVLLVVGKHAEWLTEKLLVVRAIFWVSIISMTILVYIPGLMSRRFEIILIDHFLETWMAMFSQLSIGMTIEKEYLRDSRVGRWRRSLRI